MTITHRLPQERHIAAFPGPKSAALTERRRKAVSAGVSSLVPVYAADADGGVVVDVDGNSFIDLGAGIAVTSVGASNPAVAAAVTEQSTHFAHTCFTITPYEGYVEVAELLAELTPATTRSAPPCSTRAPRPWRTPSRWPASRPAATRSSPSTTPTTDVRTSRWR